MTLARKRGLGHELNQRFDLDHRGLRFNGHMSLKEWESLGQVLVGHHNGAQWALGDWLVYGFSREKKKERWVGGEKFRRAIKLTGLSGSYISLLYRCALAFSPQERNHSLSWSHYAAVLPIKDADERDRLLRAAIHEGWSSKKLRAFVVQRVGGTDPSKDKPKLIQCPHCEVRFVLKPEHIVH